VAERTDMNTRNERGNGKLGSILSLALIVAFAYAAWNVAPVYIDHYGFTDKVNEIARTPRYKAPSDDRIMDLLMKEVRERRLYDWIRQQNFKISTVETSRQITVTYERTVEVLPGWKHTFKFKFTADQPLV
jgi:hypothetical protein